MTAKHTCSLDGLPASLRPPTCPDCGEPMTFVAQLPPKGELPGVSGYWCDDCQIEQTEEDEHGPA